MRLDMLLLAEAASAINGRLYIHGGGITKIETPGVPVLIPTLTIVARFAVDDEGELAKEHRLSLRVRDPDGALTPLGLAIPVPPQPAPQLAPGEDRYLQMALQFGPIPATREGRYTVELRVDETEHAVNLPVVIAPSAEQA